MAIFPHNRSQVKGYKLVVYGMLVTAFTISVGSKLTITMDVGLLCQGFISNFIDDCKSAVTVLKRFYYVILMKTSIF